MSHHSAIQGVGLGLRGPHVPDILAGQAKIPWFEILADNYLIPNGLMERQLASVRTDHPVVFHCVGMSLGSLDALDTDYLRALATLIERFEPAWVSDHVSFTSFGDEHFHDLLPLPYTEEALDHLSERILRVQDFLKRPLVVENPSTYLRFKHSTLSEAEFHNALCDKTGCGLLLDVNNAYVNQFNHGDCAREFLSAINPQHVKQAHLAGYEDRGSFLLDAHCGPVSDAVWELFSFFVERFPQVPAMIEWDNNLSDFAALVSEQAKAAAIVETQLKQVAA